MCVKCLRDTFFFFVDSLFKKKHTTIFLSDLFCSSCHLLYLCSHGSPPWHALFQAVRGRGRCTRRGKRSCIRNDKGSDRGTGSGKDKGAEPDDGPRRGLEHVLLGVQGKVLALAGVHVGTGNDRGMDRCCDDRRGIRNARDIRGADILGNTSRYIFLLKKCKNISYVMFSYTLIHTLIYTHSSKRRENPRIL